MDRKGHLRACDFDIWEELGWGKARMCARKAYETGVTEGEKWEKAERASTLHTLPRQGHPLIKQG